MISEYLHDLTADFVRSILLYDPLTGIFTWKHRPEYPQNWNTRYVGKKAGRISAGYIGISIAKKRYKASRLAWLYMTGQWPVDEVDHKDLNRSNDKWDNLRAATSSQNKKNLGMRSDNTSGIKGVSWDKSRSKWLAMAMKDGRQINLGRYDRRDDAITAYKKHAEENYGEYARVIVKVA